MDWSNKLEASVADAKATNRRNEDVDIMFYPGVARHYDKYVSVDDDESTMSTRLVRSVNQRRSRGRRTRTTLSSTGKIN